MFYVKSHVCKVRLCSPVSCGKANECYIGLFFFNSKVVKYLELSRDVNFVLCCLIAYFIYFYCDININLFHQRRGSDSPS